MASLTHTTLSLPQKVHQQLKEISLQKKTPMGKLILEALKQVYFKSGQKTSKDLWGCVKNHHVSFDEFKKIKNFLPSLLFGIDHESSLYFFK